MSVVFNSVWLHVILGARNSRSFAPPLVREKVHDFMKKQFEEQGCSISAINGSAGQVHCLFLHNLERSVDEVVEQVKKNTAHFINEEKLFPGEFEWEQEYSIFSVTKSEFKDVENYIAFQRKRMDEENGRGFKKEEAKPAIRIKPPGNEISPKNFSMN